MQGVMITCEPHPRVLSTLLEGSLPFWHWLHLRNLKVIGLPVEHCTCGFHTHRIPYDFYVPVLSNSFWGIASILALVALDKSHRHMCAGCRGVCLIINKLYGCSWWLPHQYNLLNYVEILRNILQVDIRMWWWSHVASFQPLERSSRFWHRLHLRLYCVRMDIGYTDHDHPLVDLDISLTNAEWMIWSIVVNLGIVMHGCTDCAIATLSCAKLMEV